MFESFLMGESLNFIEYVLCFLCYIFAAFCVHFSYLDLLCDDRSRFSTWLFKDKETQEHKGFGSHYVQDLTIEHCRQGSFVAFVLQMIMFCFLFLLVWILLIVASYRFNDQTLNMFDEFLNINSHVNEMIYSFDFFAMSFFVCSFLVLFFQFIGEVFLRLKLLFGVKMNTKYEFLSYSIAGGVALAVFYVFLLDLQFSNINLSYAYAIFILLVIFFIYAILLLRHTRLKSYEKQRGASYYRKKAA